MQLSQPTDPRHSSKQRLKQSSRFTYVDLLRGIAAIAVLLNHYKFFYISSGSGLLTEPLDLGRQPFSSVLMPFYEYGAKAVPLFWMLSGFVFIATYGISGRSTSPREFFVARFSRLYPLHLATLITIGLLQQLSLRLFGHYQIYTYNDLYHFVLQLFMASNWGLERGYSFNGPIWSVSIEILIYVVFLIYLMTTKISWQSTLAMIFAFIAMKILGFGNIAVCGIYFFTGIMLHHAVPAMRKMRKPIALIVATLLVTLFFSISFYESLAPQGLVQLCTFFSLVTLFAAVIICDLYLREVPQRLRWIGNSTYSVYLIHIPVILTAAIGFRLFNLPNSFPDRPMVLIVFLATVIAAASLVYQFFELPMQKLLRKRFSSSGSNGVTGAKPASDD